jgi:hypothetical protein
MRMIKASQFRPALSDSQQGRRHAPALLMRLYEIQPGLWKQKFPRSRRIQTQIPADKNQVCHADGCSRRHAIDTATDLPPVLINPQEH